LQGVAAEKLQGTIQNDILKEYIARGTYIYPPAPSMRIVTDIFAFCKEQVPQWNTISISGYHMREAGSSAVQEVAFTLADGITYVDAAIKAGLDVDAFAARLSFFFNCHNNFLEEIAKFRAARRLWARIMKERFHAKSPSSLMLRFHTQTAGCTLTAQQPYNNVVRVAFQAMAAVLGGALALPTEDAVRVALRTQQIVASETGVADTIDPLAGSYLIESLTAQIEEGAKKYIEKIDQMGGVIKAIETGYIQNEIQNSAYQYQKDVEKGEQVVVGLNKFTVEEKPLANLLRVDPQKEKYQKEKLAKVKSERDNGKVLTALAKLKAAAQGSEHLLPSV
jgi:methylmalonyl-CoA mutase N-terminal domain/subunit